MSAEKLLACLQRVRKHGNDRWMACCPAHEDRSPSLSIRETEDGRVLIHCFAGCEARDVISAAGLEFGDLFPPNYRPPSHQSSRPRDPQRPNHWHALHDVLKLMSKEAVIVALVAEDLARGSEMTDKGVERLLVAAKRLRSAVEATR